MNPNILVTGGTGLVGSYLLRWLSHLGYTRLTATCQNEKENIPKDLQQGINWKTLVFPDQQETYDVVHGHDWVIHTAGLISYSRSDQDKLFAINQEGTRQVVNACLEEQISHLIYVGSIAALGKEKDGITLNENVPWLQNEFSTTYGLTKYLGEMEVWRGATEGLPVSVLLPSVILGTGDWHRSSLQLVDRIAHQPGYYPGGQTGYVDVRDVARFMELLLRNHNSGARWILNGEDVKYEKIYKLIGKELGLKKKFRPAPRWLAEIMLMGKGLWSGKRLGKEILKSAYGSFSYDHSKSLELEGFQYRPLEDTIREIAGVFLSGDPERRLEFS